MELPTKEAAAFKRLLVCWEEKQWKAGLRLARQILGAKGCSEHGETLAMRGLLLLGVGRREEAMAEVRRGLRTGLTSSRCWHAFGLLCRSERRFGEAMRSFKQALKLEPGNLTTLRDLSVLQVRYSPKESEHDVFSMHTRYCTGAHQGSRGLPGHQTGHVPGNPRLQFLLMLLILLIITINLMWQAAPGQRGSWSGLAVALHLAGDLQEAVQVRGVGEVELQVVQVMEEFRKSQQEVNRDVMNHIMKQMFDKKNDFAYEHSELVLYQNMVLCDAGQLEEALQHLEQWGQAIVDRVRKEEVRGKLLYQLGRREEAAATYEGLISKNPDNTAYYRQLLAANREEDRVKVLRRFCSLHPKARAPRLLVLELLKGKEFEEALLDYLKEGIRKGIPSLLETIGFLYKDKEKNQTLLSLLYGFKESLTKFSQFQEGDGDKEDPSCLVWTLHLLSIQYGKQGQWEEAVQCSDQALGHTPTLVELYMGRGELHALQGEALLAAQWMEEAQGLDTGDRAVACEAARYLARAGRIEEATAVMGQFTKPGQPVLEELIETQCSWFLVELAKAHRARGEVGEALVSCAQLRDIFQEVEEDQIDFHLFAMYRMRLSHYVEMLRFEDRLRTFGFFEEVAQIAVSIYLELHDRATGVIAPEEEKENLALSESEKRKLRNKAKKAQQKEKEAKSKGKPKPEKVEAECLTPQKITYSPRELESTTSPMEEALRFLAPLQDVLGDRISTQLLVFEVALRRNKPLLMLRAVKRAEIVAPGCEEVTALNERLRGWLAGRRVGEVVAKLLTEQGIKV